MNGLIAIFTGVYLMRVTYQGNHWKLLELLGSEKDFLKWGFSLFVLYKLYQSKVLGDAGNWIIILALTGLGITVVSKNKDIFSEFNKLISIGDKK